MPTITTAAHVFIFDHAIVGKTLSDSIVQGKSVGMVTNTSGGNEQCIFDYFVLFSMS